VTCISEPWSKSEQVLVEFKKQESKLPRLSNHAVTRLRLAVLSLALSSQLIACAMNSDGEGYRGETAKLATTSVAPACPRSILGQHSEHSPIRSSHDAGDESHWQRSLKVHRENTKNLPTTSPAPSAVSFWL